MLCRNNIAETKINLPNYLLFQLLDLIDCINLNDYLNDICQLDCKKESNSYYGNFIIAGIGSIKKKILLVLPREIYLTINWQQFSLPFQLTKLFFFLCLQNVTKNATKVELFRAFHGNNGCDKILLKMRSA